MNQSPLADRHLALNAKMADFGGWLMPIEYPQTGAIAEYTAVRQQVGIFDVSHLGKISVIGAGSVDFINKMVTNDLTKITTGQAQYTLLCNEDGGVVDDLIIYRNSDSDLFLIPNASNTTSVFEILQSNCPAGIKVTNLHKDFAVLAVQGPDSAKVLGEVGVVAELDYMSFVHTKIDNCPVILCRTGYTGESFWPMPLPVELRASLDSPVADLANIGDRMGGMLVAGIFLKEFIDPQTPWLHLDIAGPAYNEKTAHGYTPVGGTGIALRSLVQLAELASSQS